MLNMKMYKLIRLLTIQEQIISSHREHFFYGIDLKSCFNCLAVILHSNHVTVKYSII